MPDTVNGQVLKFAKSVYQLEKGLPPNTIVPQLKAKVENMREKMPIIQDLCNPSLKARHWELIEKILDYKFNPDEGKSLKLLDELKAFEHGEEIQEVSGQASSEASLEGILKKVISLYIFVYPFFQLFVHTSIPLLSIHSFRYSFICLYVHPFI